MSTSEVTFGTARVAHELPGRTFEQEPLSLYPGIVASLRIALSNARSRKDTTTSALRELGRETGSSC